MRRRGCFLVAFWAALVFAVSIGPADASSLPTGVSVFGGTPASLSGAEDEQIADAGATQVLRWLRWDQVAPEMEPFSWDPADPAEGAYDWSAIDQWVISARAAGLNPILQIYGAPKWAQGCAPQIEFGALAVAPCDPAPAKLADFAEAASRRYSGDFGGLPRVKFWQILNEPNLYVFFGPQFDANDRLVSPAIYRNILKATYPAIKAGNPSNVVIAAGLSPFSTIFSPSPLDFARRLFCLNSSNKPIRSSKACRGGVKLDVFDMHPYTSGAPTRKSIDPDDVQMGDLGKLKAVLSAADRANRISGVKSKTPLWITEMAWDSRPPDPGGLKMSILTRWTAEALYRSWRAGVSRFFWYSLRDQDPGDRPWSATTQSGLYFRGDTIEQDRPKRSLKAFRFPFVAYSKKRKRGVYFWGRTPTSKNGRVLIQLKRSDGWRRIAVTKAKGGGVFKGFAKSKAASRKRGFVQAVYRKEGSVPFGLKPVKDFFQRPFG